MDWHPARMARGHCRASRQLLVISASPSPRGAAGAAADLRRVLTNTGASVIGSELAVPRAFTQFRHDGYLADPASTAQAAIGNQRPYPGRRQPPRSGLTRRSGALLLDAQQRLIGVWALDIADGQITASARLSTRGRLEHLGPAAEVNATATTTTRLKIGKRGMTMTGASDSLREPGGPGCVRGLLHQPAHSLRDRSHAQLARGREHAGAVDIRRRPGALLSGVAAEL